MENQAFSYHPGRGVPLYLLWRTNSGSTIYSNGASEIFLSSIETACTNGFIRSSMSIDSRSVSSNCTWSTITDSYARSDFLESTKFETNSSQNDISVNDETRTIRSTRVSIDSGNQTILNCSRLIDAVEQENNEDSAYVMLLKNVPILTASCFANCNNASMDTCDGNNPDSNVYTEPEPMFPLTVLYFGENEEGKQRKESTENMHVDGQETETIIVLPDPVVATINYDRCYLWGHERVSACGTTSRNCYYWIPECISFADLAERDIRPYLKQLRVISETEQDNIIITEKNLIANRLLQSSILIDYSMLICPRHRSAFGIHWYDMTSLCSHPDHVSKKRTSVLDCRRAKLSMCSWIEGFPIGGRLCAKHRKRMAVPDDFPSIAGESQYNSGTQFAIEYTRDTMNRILAETNISPIRSQVSATLQHQSKSSLRRLLSKLNRGTGSLQEKLAESVAPWQSNELIELNKLSTGTAKQQVANACINNEIVHNLKEIYNMHVDNNMPFVEQVCLIALLPARGAMRILCKHLDALDMQ
ncbi:unnamed protein product [Rotaria magnacalcarata]|uniref:Uncharacterized protein n=1 Tax=Rotaria magnacalcarata TaxID=392030 RepID=A0A815NYL3_9BILA|nr:unnamed protein product [Rotaria magnacalcarata]CAF1669773.1 unnamed protein product [Rotaria magnacalcarata]CAF4029709.1 unnamed protein product [Rotaria magnacalcarata]CAF4040232.1 unnamed protein product [Rotaria magnacalcarata]